MYVHAMMPQQLRVSVKYAAELLLMGLRLALSMHERYSIIRIDSRNTYNESWKLAVLKRHRAHPRLRELVQILES
jgi:hypothetical protein